MCCGVLSLGPAPVPVPNSDYEQRSPEDEVGPCLNTQHLHPGNTLYFHVVLQFTGGCTFLVEEYDIRTLVFFTFYLLEDVWEGVEERPNLESLQSNRGEVLIKLVEMVHGEGQAEQVDENPEEVKHIMTVGTLHKRLLRMWVTMQTSSNPCLTCTRGQEGSVTWSSALAAIPPLRKVGPRLMVMLANLDTTLVHKEG